VLKLRLDDMDPPDPSLLADYDILLTDSLVRLCYHIQFGKVDPESLYPAWNMSRQVHNANPVGAIEKRLRTATLARGLKNIRPEIEYYHLLKSVLRTDENDNIIFINDVYDRDQQVLDGLNEGFTIWQTRAIN
jgi:hypothetical protein